jgi:hypothetical protein
MKALTTEIQEYGGDGVLSASVEYERTDGEGRCQYRYRLAYAGEEIASGDDLRSGCGADVDHPGMLATLLAFLGSAGESYHYHGMKQSPDDPSSFSDQACEIAYMLADEITMAQLELEPEGD